MINHVVLFKLKENTELLSQLNSFKQMLMALPALIPEIKHLEVGINHDLKSSNYHLCIISHFENLESMRIYLAHPEHIKVSSEFKDKIESRSSVDFTF
ncbi:MAG: Dabb family protein [Mangrovibacterium sp.]